MPWPNSGELWQGIETENQTVRSIISKYTDQQVATPRHRGLKQPSAPAAWGSRGFSIPSRDFVHNIMIANTNFKTSIEKVRAGRKPGSVVGQSFIWDSRRRLPQATYPGVRSEPAARQRGRILPYLVLLPTGFTLPRSVTTRAVRSYRTISTLPAPEGA